MSKVGDEFSTAQQQLSAKLGGTKLDGDFLHHVLGVITSFHKLKSLINLKKNYNDYVAALGEIYWHIAGLTFKLRTPFYPLIEPPLRIPVLYHILADVEERIIKITEYYNKYITYNEEFPSDTVTSLINEILSELHHYCMGIGRPVREVLNKHLDKLKANGFVQDAELAAQMVRELRQIKQMTYYYRRKGRPTRQEKIENLAIPEGEVWNDKESYPENFKKPRKKRKKGAKKKKVNPAWIRSRISKQFLKDFRERQRAERAKRNAAKAGSGEKIQD
jgi:hypothetical protein